MAEETISSEQQLVVFDLDNESYGINIESVREIIRLQEITKVPRTPDFVEGIINLRGKVIPVIDLRTRFGLAEQERDEETRIVNVDIAGHEIGMVVDAVTEVLRISRDSVEPPSSVITTDDSGYLKGIAKLENRLILTLDLDQILSKTEHEALYAADLAA